MEIKMKTIQLVLVVFFSLTIASCGGGGGETSGQSDTAPPSIPTSLTATALSSSQIDLAWAASADNVGVTGYKIYRDGSLIASQPVLVYSDIGLSHSTLYCYTVAAFDAAGNTSSQSASQCATPLVVPTAPTGFSATAGNGQVTIRWDAVAGTTSYNLYMASATGVTKSNYLSLSNGMQHVGVTSPYTHSSLTNGITYYFVVTAVNANGESGESSQVSATPQVLPPPPAAPTGIVANAGDGLITIRWDAVAGTTSYNLYMASATGVTKSNYLSLSNGMQHVGVTSPYTHSSLTNGITYYFVVTAVNANGESGESGQVSATPLVSPVTTDKLNDTGVTASQCYQAGGSLVACNSAGAIALNNVQDGMVGRDADMASNDNTDGRLGFSFASIAGGCVLDNVTGLMWEIKTADGGLHDSVNAYTNYDSTNTGQKRGSGFSWLAPTQTDIDASTNSVGFKNSVNLQGLCGYGDWRVPTVDELQSIVDYGGSPNVDAKWFPNTQGFFWTSTSVVDLGNIDFARAIDFDIGYACSGSVNECVRDTLHHVRLVRAGKSQTAPRYTTSVDGQEVTDNQNKLIWRRCLEGTVFDGFTCSGTWTLFLHEAALQRATGQASSTGIAWRLPNIKELSSIVDNNFYHPAVDPTIFPNTPQNTFWSASPFLGNTAYLAWGINFGQGGDIYSYERVNGGSYVRLVRTGP